MGQFYTNAFTVEKGEKEGSGKRVIHLRASLRLAPRDPLTA